MMLYEEILKDFQARRVKYILVGGLALNLLGGERSTHDMDVLVDMTDTNLAKVVSILTKRGYKVKQPVDPMGIADKDVRTDWIANKNMRAFNFYKYDDMKEVDIIIDSPVKYADAKQDSRRIKIGALTIPVISIRKLIKMKEKAGRGQDRLDIAMLKTVERIRRGTR